MERINKFTGKPEPEIDKQQDVLDDKCDDCGSHLIKDCLICGAPVCCPKCCG